MLRRIAAATSARAKQLLVALLLLQVLAAQEDVAVVTEGPADTGTCDAAVVLEPGVHSVHCTSPAIRMTPGQVRTEHDSTRAQQHQHRCDLTCLPLVFNPTESAGYQYQLVVSKSVS